MKLKTRSVTILTDEEVALVSGGVMTAPYLMSNECAPTEAYGGCEDTYTQTFECYSRECDPYETFGCSINGCLDTVAQCDTQAQCDTTACG